MMQDISKEAMCAIASKLGLPEISPSWQGIDAVLPLLDKIKGEGGIVIIKFDGERNSEDDNGQYTLMISGTPLAGDFIRTDSETVEEGLATVITEYAEKVWQLSINH
ncbi:hypothetical protein CWC22_010620 [Pseudoalteromonas rubra]|uniref:Uncharacterized protein n=1 Tax=Pseudoalteromonas rubra TaxID=43658 RepID=A0A5S3UPG0_9GAMM|nr:hypothetical protein [Pseudoalteromonas rubra]QPB83412.1 hypothetical protein CWC22_010620 [Pseudoalteromonas rubra]